MTMTMSVVSTDANPARAAVAGFLAGYCGTTRRSYATDLRLFAAWCEEAKLKLFAVFDLYIGERTTGSHLRRGQGRADGPLRC